MVEAWGEQGELLFAADHPASTLHGAVERGELARLGRGIYTSALDDDPLRVVRRNWAQLVSRRFPGGVVTDRSARTGGPTAEGLVFVSAPSAGLLELPGLGIVARAGAGPQPGDLELSGGIFVAGRARALLENLRPSRRSKSRPAPTLGSVAVADWIDHLCHVDGEAALRRYREQARSLAVALGLDSALADHLDDMIGAALGTRTVDTSSAPLRARQRGLAYDQDRIARLDLLGEALRNRPLAEVPDLPEDQERRRFLPFHEAYFSNFIEGTEFTPDEARAIVESGAVPVDRPADGHDVLGTYRVLADGQALAERADTATSYLDRLQRWHRSIMGGRPEAGPGEWKVAANRAGRTEFVAPDLVVGTLVQAWDRLERLATPAQRAVFALFAVAEVHPFADGNGRVARVAMTAELVAGAEVRVLVPTVCRNDYLAALRRLSRQDRPDLLIELFDRLQRFSARIDFSTSATADAELTATNAFVDATDAERRGVHLVVPEAAR